VVLVVVCCSASTLAAQASGPSAPVHEEDVAAAVVPQDAHQHDAATQVDHAAHQHAAGPAMLFGAREASGTAWQPETTPMYGIHHRAGSWDLMWHGNAFLQYLDESGTRGRDQAGSINWMMGMARHTLAGVRFGVRGMLSAEPWSISGCGYPDLLATGESCDGDVIHDRQHPHDALMEVAVEYERPLAAGLRWHAYAGLAGEPALGPAAFPHRGAAMANPLAPISHHWLDATHITFGVVTGGISGARWKAEGSVFNGHEPDEHRAGLDLAPLESFSGRLWFAPSAAVVLQVSAGHLADAEAADAAGLRNDVDRVTASATFHRGTAAGRNMAATIAWGRNSEEDDPSNALLIEGSVALRDRDTWFGRFEVAGKRGHDLDVPGPEATFRIAKLQGGYTRYVRAWHGLQPGFGATVSAGFVPETLESVYGRRVNPGAGVFLTLRPAAHAM
jgi:hypothetical protein